MNIQSKIPTLVAAREVKRKQMHWFWKLVLWLAGIFVVLVVFGAWQQPPPPETPLMKAITFYLPGEALFQNKEAFAVTDCTMTLQMGGANAYYFHVGRLDPGQELDLPANVFVNLDRERFNSDRYVPRAVLMECLSPSGKKIGGGRTVP